MAIKGYFFSQLFEKEQFLYSPFIETKVFLIASSIHLRTAVNCFSLRANSRIFV